MSNVAIRAEKLSKQYRMDQRRGWTDLRETITNAAQRSFRSAEPDKNLPGTPLRNRSLWALQDVCFEIRSGDVVGILGDNGSGKTTLLKLLARITHPTSGYAEIYGTVKALLDVGAGLHGELTGRENVYLNGSVIGMSPEEIRRKFVDIVEFAGLADFIDTPLKHYSSGMCVRLAFSISVHAVSEILLIDEVLAVGDVPFQQRCLNKLSDAVKAGCTVMFVSHDLNHIRQLCNRAMVFTAGQLVFDGRASAALDHYVAPASKAETVLSIAR